MAKKLLKGYEKRRRIAEKFWAKVIKDNETLTPTEIAAKYINPRTGKNYTREHIHDILRQAKQK